MYHQQVMEHQRQLRAEAAHERLAAQAADRVRPPLRTQAQQYLAATLAAVGRQLRAEPAMGAVGQAGAAPGANTGC